MAFLKNLHKFSGQVHPGQGEVKMPRSVALSDWSNSLHQENIFSTYLTCILYLKITYVPYHKWKLEEYKKMIFPREVYEGYQAFWVQ